MASAALGSNSQWLCQVMRNPRRMIHHQLRIPNLDSTIFEVAVSHVELSREVGMGPHHPAGWNPPNPVSLLCDG